MTRRSVPRALIFVLGLTTPIPLALRLGPTHGYNVALGLLASLPIIAALAYARRREVWPSPRDRIFRLLWIFIALSAASVIVGVLRYRNPNGVISFAYQLVLLGNAFVGYLNLQTIQEIVLFWRGVILTTLLAAAFVSGSVVGNVACSGFSRTHNSLLVMTTVHGWPNGYGVLLAVACLLGLALLLIDWRAELKAVYVPAIFLLLGALFLTFSRTAYVVLLLALVVLLWRLRHRLTLIHFAVGVAVLAMTVLLFTPLHAFRERFCSAALTEPESIVYGGTLEERLRFDLIVVRDLDPVTLLIGSGYENTNVVLASHQNEEVVPGLRVGQMTTHNEYLTILLKNGLIGLVILLAVFYLIARRVYSRSRQLDSPIGLAFIHWFTIVIALFVSFAVSETLRYWPVAAIFWLMAGAAVNVPWRATPPAADPRTPPEAAS